MKTFLKRLLFGPQGRAIEHAFFGKAILIETKSGPYWEAEPLLNGETISVAIETVAGEEPTPQQERFYCEITQNLSEAFAKAAPHIIPRYEEWMRQPFPSDWRVAFKFVGLSVPVDGDAKNPWDLGFECIPDGQGHLFTCYFKDGSPVGVSVDG